MALDEAARYELRRALFEVGGDEPAVTLMDHLPPSGWGDVATRQDVGAVTQRVAALEHRTEQRFDALEQRTEQRFARSEQRTEQRFDRLDERLDRQTRLFIATTIAALFSSAVAATAITLTIAALA